MSRVMAPRPLGSHGVIDVYGQWLPVYGATYATNTTAAATVTFIAEVTIPRPQSPAGFLAWRSLQAAARCLPGLLPPWPTAPRLVSRVPVRRRLLGRGRAAGSPSWARRK